MTKDDMGNDTEYEKMIPFRYELMAGWGIYNNTSFLIDNENGGITMSGTNYKSGNEFGEPRIHKFVTVEKNNQLLRGERGKRNPSRVR